VYALLKGHGQIAPLAVSAAINGGIAGATFFSFREYVVNHTVLLALPAASHYRRIREWYTTSSHLRVPEQSFTLWDMRINQVPESAISGAFTGAVLNAWKRGPKGAVPGMNTGMIACSLIQLLYNEAGVARVKYVMKTMQASRDTPLPPAVQEIPNASHSDSPRPAFERILSMLGFHRMSNEEYLERLKEKRDGYLRRIAELEQEAERKKESASSSSSSDPRSA